MVICRKLLWSTGYGRHGASTRRHLQPGRLNTGTQPEEGGLKESTGLRCRNYERLEKSEEEARKEYQERSTVGDEIDGHIQQVCDLGGPAVLVCLSRGPSCRFRSVHRSFTAGNFILRPGLDL